jgi:ATP-binding cassette subfamily F protein 3
MNQIKSDDGICFIGKNVFLGYYDQEQSNLEPEKTILDEVWDDFPNLTTTQVRTYLAAFLFTVMMFLKKFQHYWWRKL